MPSPRFQQAYAEYQQQRLDKAETTLRSALRSNPSDTESVALLATILMAKRQYDQAEFYLQRAMALAPASGMLRGNWGDLLGFRGRREDALRAYQEAVNLEPVNGRLQACLVSALLEAGRFTEAMAAGARACELDPSDPWHWCNWAASFAAAGRSSEAAEIYDRALALHPQSPPLIQGRICTANYLPSNDAAARSRMQIDLAARLCATVPVESPTFRQPRDAERPLRIGLLSPDLRKHSVAYFVLSFLPRIDRTGFSVFAYHSAQMDDVSRAIAAHCTQFRHVEGKGDIEICKQIRDDQIDVLLELAGHTTSSRLPVAIRRAAPVQINYLGYPATTGCRNIDYRLVDAVTDPPESPGGLPVDALCTERLIRLQRCFLAYSPHPDAPAEIPGPAGPRPFTFASLNNLQKINDDCVHVWSRVLQASPGTRMYIKNFGCRDPVVAANLLERFRAGGLEDTSRVTIDAFRPDARRHFEIFPQIDAALDTWPYNGTTTTCECLWMGVPVVGIRGSTHVSRVGESILKAAGQSELIADDQDDYVRRAAALATSGARTIEQRRDLHDRVRSSQLCDGADMARSLQSAIRTAWRAWCAASPG